LIEFNLTAVLQLLNFVLLLWVLKKFVFESFFKVLDQRRELIEGEIRRAEKIRRDAEEYAEQTEKKLKKASDNARRIVEEAQTKAEKIVEEAREKAKREAEKILEAATDEAARIRKEAVTTVHTAAVRLGVKIASHILKRVANEKLQHKVVERTLEELGKDGKI